MLGSYVVTVEGSTGAGLEPVEGEGEGDEEGEGEGDEGEGDEEGEETPEVVASTAGFAVLLNRSICPLSRLR